MCEGLFVSGTIFVLLVDIGIVRIIGISDCVKMIVDNLTHFKNYIHSALIHIAF